MTTLDEFIETLTPEEQANIERAGKQLGREKRLQNIRERADYYAQEDLDVWGIDHARYVVDVRWLLAEIERLEAADKRANIHAIKSWTHATSTPLESLREIRRYTCDYYEMPDDWTPIDGVE